MIKKRSKKVFAPRQLTITVEERARQNAAFARSVWPDIRLPEEPKYVRVGP
jgi:hypothetical protein